MSSPPSLQVSHDGDVIFTSDGSWLHPLFELESYLSGTDYTPSKLYLRDKIIGKAAALLILRLGIVHVHAGILSKPAIAVFQNAGIACSGDEVVDLIDCATEALLSEVSDPDAAYGIITARIAENRVRVGNKAAEGE